MEGTLGMVQHHGLGVPGLGHVLLEQRRAHLQGGQYQRDAHGDQDGELGPHQPSTPRQPGPQL